MIWFKAECLGGGAVHKEKILWKSAGSGWREETTRSNINL